MNETAKLLFVYNADSGLFNTVADIGHKLFSPQTYSCDLCALTHGYFQERKEWKQFIESLEISCEFLHRDEFKRIYPDSTYLFPCVLLESSSGLGLCLSDDEISQYQDLTTLIQSIEACL